MSCIDKERRELNFSAKEEQILTCLVKKYSIILENKKTDSDMNKKKHGIWVILCKEFNGQSGDTYRSIDALKNKYLNLKRSAKKKFSEEKRKLYETGGGPLVKVPDSIVDVDIREILASQMTGFDSQFDSDRPAVLDSENITDTIEDENTCPTSEQVPSTSKVESFVLEENSPNCSIKKDWSKQTVTNLRTPVSEKLNVTADGSIRKRDNFLKTKLADWTKAKQNTVNVQQQCLMVEHQQKMKFVKEKHEAEMKQMKEIHEQRITINAEEHQIKRKILNLQEQKLLEELSK